MFVRKSTSLYALICVPLTQAQEYLEHRSKTFKGKTVHTRRCPTQPHRFVFHRQSSHACRKTNLQMTLLGYTWEDASSTTPFTVGHMKMHGTIERRPSSDGRKCLEFCKSAFQNPLLAPTPPAEVDIQPPGLARPSRSVAVHRCRRHAKNGLTRPLRLYASPMVVQRNVGHCYIAVI